MSYNKALLNKIHKPLMKAQGGGSIIEGRPTVKQISQMPNKGYEPSDAVKNTKAGLAAASMVAGPFSFIPGIASATYDVGTATKYALDGQWENAGHDLMQAGVSALPTAGIMAALSGMAGLSKANKAMRGIRAMKTASDLKDMSEASSITDRLTGRVQEFNKAGKETFMRRPRSAQEVKEYNQNLQRYYRTGSTDEVPEYLRPYESPEFAGGGVIIDPMGQWAHPGKVTKIPSNNITMKGVNYPVYGVPDYGQPRMMYPGQEYHFPQASNVTEFPQMGGGGYVVTRSHDRKGKTHKVTGPDGTVKYFGDASMGQHPKDPERKKAFYARHKHNLDKNPYFRAFARATWEEGGEIDEMAQGGEMIRRADGHYSKRGLWDNIRDNRGSGKEPSKEMLSQERKIRAEHKQMGGSMINDKVDNMYFSNGGTNNPGFKALPDYVQHQILSNLAYGGYYDKGGPVKLNPTQQAYAEQMYKKYGKVVMTDKATNQTIYGTKKPDGSWDLNQFEVLTGADSNPQDQYISGYGLNEIEKMSAADQKRQKVTPIGVFGLSKNPNIYGMPGYNVGNTDIAYHVTYEGADDKSRRYLYDNGNAQDNYRSYGCINCQKPSIEALQKFVGDSGVTAIIDSRLSPEENSKWMKKNTPSMGFDYQAPRSPMPGKQQAEAVAVKRTTPVVQQAAPRPVPTPQQGQMIAEGPSPESMNSIVDFLSYAGLNTSKANRAQLASRLGIKDYDFSAKKNIEMLNYLKQHGNVLNNMPSSFVQMGGSTEYAYGGQPCYECGGMYAAGGYYDCDDQEKDPETGKCKAEVVRSRENAAANKAASADMNAWAKQVAAMDRENARQDAAQYAGQRSFDYDWMQSPVDKSEKKAAMAQYKQFFQQNPNTFVPDDTSGFSPEQKYIIASKLKQKISTPMGSKAFQQKFNQDPRFLDLQRLQSDIVPTMGGWGATQNWLFGNKEYGGIHINPANEGKFTAAAQRAGMGVQEFANQVLQNRDDYSSTTVKRANFARNASKWQHADGGPVVGQEIDVTPEQLHMLQQGGYTFEII